MDGTIVVASFPLESWADEVRDLIQAQGIAAAVVYRGPRAWQVLVDESDGPAVEFVVADIGYLTGCPV
jgi:hypothetical protein